MSAVAHAVAGEVVHMVCPRCHAHLLIHPEGQVHREDHDVRPVKFADGTVKGWYVLICDANPVEP